MEKINKAIETIIWSGDYSTKNLKHSDVRKEVISLAILKELKQVNSSLIDIETALEKITRNAPEERQ